MLRQWSCNVLRGRRVTAEIGASRDIWAGVWLHDILGNNNKALLLKTKAGAMLLFSVTNDRREDKVVSATLWSRNA